MPVLSVKSARELVTDCMRATGHSLEDAAIISDHIIDAELRGLSFGGLPRALSVAERIRATSTPPKPITVTRETPVSATLDGGDQVGYLVARRATEIALKKASEHGIAVVGARNTWYTGMFSYYLEMVTAAGFMGMVAGSGWKLVAPHGGTEGKFGTNPIAFGFPSKSDPIIWDIGTSNVMLGEAILSERLGVDLAPGLAFDRDGQPTEDPAAALAGAFTVWGGHKGSGLSMVVQLLGMMCGADASPKGQTDVGFFLVVVDPETLTSADDYQTRVSEFADSLRSTRPLDPARPVRVPFDRSIDARNKTLAGDAIEVSQPVLEGLLRIGSDTNLRN